MFVVLCLILGSSADGSILRGNTSDSEMLALIGDGRHSVAGMMKHLQAFEAAADANGGARAVQNGYNASAEYIVESLAKLGDFYEVTKQHFTAPIYYELAAPTLKIHGMEPALDLNRCEQVTGWQHYYVGCDYAGVRYGGSGKNDVTADIEFVSDPCTTEGWSTFTAGNIALVEASSACDYYSRGMNAEDAGAGALIFMSTAGLNTLPGSRVYDSATWPHKLVTMPCIGVTHGIGNLLSVQHQSNCDYKYEGGGRVHIQRHRRIQNWRPQQGSHDGQPP